MRKIAVVVTARPSYSRIKTALRAIQDHPELELQLVVAASALLERYGTAVRYMEADGFPIAARVFNVLEGEVTGNIDEKVRHAITKLADRHLVASTDARQRVIRMGEEEETVINTGCPSIDLAAEVRAAPSLDFDVYDRYGGVGDKLDLAPGYLVVMQHPVTTEYANARKHVTLTLKAVHKLGVPTLWFWPNVDAGSDGTSKGIRVYREHNRDSQIHFFKNMEGLDFLRVLYNARCLVGNSSVGIRECAYLGVPVVNIGTRQSGRQRGPNVVDTDYDEDEITAAIRAQMAHGHFTPADTYGGGDAGAKIAEELRRMPLTFAKRITF